MSAITVLHVQAINRGQLKAVAKVRLGGIVLHGVRVLAQDDGEPWIGWPQAPARANGTGWFACVSFVNPALADRVSDAVLAAWRESQA